MRMHVADTRDRCTPSSVRQLFFCFYAALGCGELRARRRRLHHLVEALHHVHREADRGDLVGERARDRLTDHQVAYVENL